MDFREKSVYDKKAVLFMLSGRRNSFLSARRLIKAGFCIHMITYDNGCMSGIEHTKTVADRIISKFGEERAQFAGVYGIISSLYRLQETSYMKHSRSSIRSIQFWDLSKYLALLAIQECTFNLLHTARQMKFLSLQKVPESCKALLLHFQTW